MRASATDVSGLAANDPATVAAVPRHPKLIEQLREALRSRHYSRRTVQELLGYRDVKTTMIHTHVLGRGPSGVRSPLGIS